MTQVFKQRLQHSQQILMVAGVVIWPASDCKQLGSLCYHFSSFSFGFSGMRHRVVARGVAVSARAAQLGALPTAAPRSVSRSLHALRRTLSTLLTVG